jgi:hypothetical protein
MSTAAGDDDNDDGNNTMCCASCGVREGDDIKLMKCTACDLIKYCSEKCQKEHRSTHEEECKKRAAELRDEILFKQPESSYLGDCPICYLPISIDVHKSALFSCCSKHICSGCQYANAMREIEGRLQQTCPFCRHPVPESDEEVERILMSRVEANVPGAIAQMGFRRDNCGDYKSAFEYWAKAAELGDPGAHYQLARLYHEGKGVEKDEKKELYHFEEAAIGGHPDARYNLAYFEARNGRLDRATKHYIIAANQGHDDSLQLLKKNYAIGFVTKEDFAAALRAHQAAVDATKSPQREEAEAVRQKLEAARAARQK